MYRVLTAALLTGMLPIVPAVGAAGPQVGPSVEHRFRGAAVEPRVGHRFSGAAVEAVVGHRFSGAAASAEQVRVENIDGAAVDPFATPVGVTAIVFLFT